MSAKDYKYELLDPRVYEEVYREDFPNTIRQNLSLDPRRSATPKSLIPQSLTIVSHGKTVTEKQVERRNPLAYTGESRDVGVLGHRFREIDPRAAAMQYISKADFSRFWGAMRWMPKASKLWKGWGILVGLAIIIGFVDLNVAAVVIAFLALPLAVLLAAYSVTQKKMVRRLMMHYWFRSELMVWKLRDDIKRTLNLRLAKYEGKPVEEADTPMPYGKSVSDLGMSQEDILEEARKRPKKPDARLSIYRPATRRKDLPKRITVKDESKGKYKFATHFLHKDPRASDGVNISKADFARLWGVMQWLPRPLWVVLILALYYVVSSFFLFGDDTVLTIILILDIFVLPPLFLLYLLVYSIRMGTLKKHYSAHSREDIRKWRKYIKMNHRENSFGFKIFRAIFPQKVYKYDKWLG